MQTPTSVSFHDTSSTGLRSGAMARLLIVVASTRPGRRGLPRPQKPNDSDRHAYVHDHTKTWSAIVDAADAVVLVMPEYNRTFSAPLKNALDYLYEEWRYKPVGIVSYGGVSGG